MIQRFQQFSQVISSIHRHIQSIERSEMEKCGLKGSFAQYLVLLHRHPEGITSSQMCELCVVDKAAVSRAIAEMERKELVLREGAAYRAKIKLTRRGREVTEFILGRTARAVELAGQPKELRPGLYSNLECIADILQQMSKDGLPD